MALSIIIGCYTINNNYYNTVNSKRTLKEIPCLDESHEPEEIAKDEHHLASIKGRQTNLAFILHSLFLLEYSFIYIYLEQDNTIFVTIHCRELL